MRILIVAPSSALGALWARHLERAGGAVSVRGSADAALSALRESDHELVILSLGIGEARALELADYAGYRHPETKLILVSRSRFFSDGSIFAHVGNACACLPHDTAPEDLAAIARYHVRDSG